MSLEAGYILSGVGHANPDLDRCLVVLVNGRNASPGPCGGDCCPHQSRSSIGSCKNSCLHMVGNPQRNGAKGGLILIIPHCDICSSDGRGSRTDSRSWDSPIHNRPEVLTLKPKLHLVNPDIVVGPIEDWDCMLRLQTIKAIVDSHSFKVRNQMSLEECKSWTCIVLLGLRAKVQVKGLSIKD